jgi:hypothetical protein
MAKRRTRRKMSRRKTRRVRKQKGGEMSSPFGDSGGVPKGVGGTITMMSDEGVPVTKSLEEPVVEAPVVEEPSV